MKLMITYDKLWELLRIRGISQYSLIKNYQISRSQLFRIHHGNYISTKTINTLCAILNCQPGDIMEFHPDPSDLDSVQKAAKKNR
ncbi:helix-turn-helix domain-containing protein [Anaerolactibacter massiliensis]|uniref:helix-turn-helix domain-containing protein n=1 Tax=Anaerolactibacter massiliensis TaxID=2044573 RepID=UPI0019569209|nr:helix-turn-helix transcriptional regulator [Anaerolactibacter massiliensis]